MELMEGPTPKSFVANAEAIGGFAVRMELYTSEAAAKRRDRTLLNRPHHLP